MSALSQFFGGVKSIQRGTITLAAASSNTATITSVDTSKSELRFLGFYSPTAAPYIAIVLTNATTITATANGSVTATVSYEVTEFY